MMTFKPFLFIFALLLQADLVLAQTSFAEYFEYEGTTVTEPANQITHNFVTENLQPASDRIKLFEQFTNQLNSQAHYSTRPALLWFLKGLNYRNMEMALHEETIDSHKTQSTIATIEQKKITAYQQAIKLDNAKKTILTPLMYATMKYGLSGDQKIIALQKELALGGSGNNESSYWFTHWQVIGALQDAGRFDEAEKAINTLQRELKDSALEHSEYSQIPQRAKIELAQERRKKQVKNTATNNAPKKAVEKQSTGWSEFMTTTFGQYWQFAIINFVIFALFIIILLRRF